MKVTIYGTGYVGLVTGVCLAEMGHDVCCLDIDTAKIQMLKAGQVPIYEEKLEALLHKVQASGNIRFITDVKEAVNHGAIQMIAVGTPPKPDGAADLSYVLAVANSIAENISDYRVIVNKSTVPVGTADLVRNTMVRSLHAKQNSVAFDVVSNPEFLKEGRAVNDFLNPDRIIIGSDSDKATAIMRELYAPLIDEGRPFVVMNKRSAELTKYASNAFLATKISFMNEMSQIAERLNADINEVKKGMGYDQRIGSRFLNSGCGYGGSCFPKDVSALEALANNLGYEAKILRAVQETNRKQKTVPFHKISAYFDHDLKGRTIAIWGLAFKPGTDDLRDAPSLTLMEMLWEAGAKIQAFDPMAMGNASKLYGDHPKLRLCNTPESTLQNAHALAIVTEWKIFREPDFDYIKNTLLQPIIFDGRNIYDSKTVAQHGLQYCGIGCGLVNAAHHTEGATVGWEYLKTGSRGT